MIFVPVILILKEKDMITGRIYLYHTLYSTEVISFPLYVWSFVLDSARGYILSKKKCATLDDLGYIQETAYDLDTTTYSYTSGFFFL